MLLVTGASSPTGSAIVRRFAAHGHPVRGLTRSLARVEGLARSPGVELVEGDMTKPATLGRALDGVSRALAISSVQEDLVAGTPEGMIGTLDEVFAERRRCPVSRVDLTTHVKFRVEPTRFVDFARRMRAAFC